MAQLHLLALTANDAWGGYSMRVVTRCAFGALDQVRVRFYSNTASGSFIPTAASIGICTSSDQTGVVPGMTATPVPLLFSGNPGTTLGTNSNIWTDWANLIGFTSTNFLLTAFDMIAGGAGNIAGVTGTTFNEGGPACTFFEAGNTNASEQNPTGMTSLGNQCWAVGEIETQSLATGLTRLIHGGKLLTPLTSGRIIR